MVKKKDESNSITFLCGCGKRHVKSKKILMIGDTKWTLACLVDNHQRITQLIQIQDQILKLQNDFIKLLGNKFDIDITKEMEEFTSELEKQNTSADSSDHSDTGDDKITSPPAKRTTKARKKKS